MSNQNIDQAAVRERKVLIFQKPSDNNRWRK